ncbi:hypothetical protein RCL_jg28391.t1 [Rhizophagus clarus]|uniref:Uncharacterized protein n=1 Tax=Rhizophagus clarus TaxID=94130 RepID=A0A8H3M0L2_9GLOM|nr:hypothetical protein RCL_jg28391.t1 [Rhizophagus clarus]
MFIETLFTYNLNYIESYKIQSDIRKVPCVLVNKMISKAIVLSYGDNCIYAFLGFIPRSEFMDSQKDFMSRGLSLNSQMTKRLSLRVVSNNQIIMINWEKKAVSPEFKNRSAENKSSKVSKEAETEMRSWNIRFQVLWDKASRKENLVRLNNSERFIYSRSYHEARKNSFCTIFQMKGFI